LGANPESAKSFRDGSGSGEPEKRASDFLPPAKFLLDGFQLRLYFIETTVALNCALGIR
jgi:hypothetical protein